MRLQEGAVQRGIDDLRARLQESERDQAACTREVERCQRERLRGMRQLQAQARALSEAMDAACW